MNRTGATVVIDPLKNVRRERVVNQLKNAGLSVGAANVIGRNLPWIEDAKDLCTITDSELRNLKGAGKKFMKDIRDRYPFTNQVLQDCLGSQMNGTVYELDRTMNEAEKVELFEPEYRHFDYSWIYTKRGRTFARNNRLGIS